MSHRYDPCLHCPIPSSVSAKVACSTCVRVFLERAMDGSGTTENWSAVQRGLQRIRNNSRHVRARG